MGTADRTTVETNMASFPQKNEKQNYHMTHQATIGYKTKGTESRILREISTPTFTATLFTKAKMGKQLIVSWIGKMWYIHTIEYYSAL